MARDDKAITFRPDEPYYEAIKAGIGRTGLPEGHAITQALLAAFGESELLETLQRSDEHGGSEGWKPLPKTARAPGRARRR